MKPKHASLAAVSLGAFVVLSGCSQPAAVPASAPTPTAGTPAAAPTVAHAPAVSALSDAELAKIHPNEVGVVPILEYHAIGPGHTTFDRSVADFKQDLDRLYTEGYRPIALEDLLAGHIAVPAGKTPVVLTFDDARESQFRYLPDGTLDPNCAVAILQDFHKSHPDFDLQATFYVLPLSAFGPHDVAAKKMEALLSMGFTIGNHTVTHNSLKKMTDEQVQKELATAVTLTHKLAPEAKIDTVALPMGIGPKNRALLASGEYQGQTYANHAVLLVGADPAPSPFSTKFNPMHLPRIQACEGLMGITYWMDLLKSHPQRRYISDGDPNTVTVPKALAEKVDQAKLNGLTLRTY